MNFKRYFRIFIKKKNVSLDIKENINDLIKTKLYMIENILI